MSTADSAVAQTQPQTQPQETRNLSSVNVESSPQLFATMCALAAAGFDSESASMAATPAQEQLREDLLKLQGPAVTALRQFYRAHQLASSQETFSPYISFALVVGPPPKFAFLLNHDQLPPDVLGLEGFDDLLINFYREAQIEQRWRAIQPEYEKGIQRFDSPVRRIVTFSTAYLREILTPSSRTFTLYVEPMVGPRTNFRNYLDHYDVVVNPSPVLPLDDIQHAFLHYLLDPLPMKFDALVLSKKALLNDAGRAPRLPVEYQRDFTSLFTECLIRAVELRLTRQTPAQLESALVDADRSGYILVRPLVDQLKKFEKAEPAMHYYFPDLVRGIDVAAEHLRLQKVDFAATGDSTAKSQLHAHSGETELDRLLAEGDRQIALQNGPAAAEIFEHTLQKYPDLPRAMYGLAVASVLQRNGDRAKELFEKLVKPAVAPASGNAPPPADPDVLAWSHVYLGRIHDVEGDRNLALTEYRAALGVEGAPEAARVAAQRGVSTGYQPKRPSDDSKRP